MYRDKLRKALVEGILTSVNAHRQEGKERHAAAFPMEDVENHGPIGEEESDDEEELPTSNGAGSTRASWSAPRTLTRRLSTRSTSA